MRVYTVFMPALIISAALAPQFEAQASLFERLGIASPSQPRSTLLIQGVYPEFPTVSAIGGLDEAEPVLSDALAPVKTPAVTRIEPAAQKTVIASAKAQVKLAKPALEMNADPNDPSVMKDVAMLKQSTWGKILKRYGSKDGDLNRFDYSGLSRASGDMNKLDNYINDLAGLKPSAMDKHEALAYWANLYNALTVQTVARNWPVKSIKEIRSGTFTPGPWKKDIISVEGRTLSLDGIEHDTMRAQNDEPRIHYMVNCASIGCPNLMLREWRAETLEADLTAAAIAFVNSERGAKVSGGKLTVSSIYKWYKEDFGGSDSGVIAHLRQYADTELKAQLDGLTKISKDKYNWDVNKTY